MGIPETYKAKDGVHIGNPERLLHYHLKNSWIDTCSHGIRCAVIRYGQNPLYYKYMDPLQEWLMLKDVGISTIRDDGIESFVRKFIRFAYKKLIR